MRAPILTGYIRLLCNDDVNMQTDLPHILSLILIISTDIY
jgi:hypothetical protein